MTNKIVTLGENFIANRDTVKRVFKWNEQQLIAAAANEFTAKEVIAEAEQLENCVKLIKKNTGLFSSVRGNAKMLIASKMYLSGDPEGYIGRVTEMVKVIKKEIGSSDFTPMIASVFAEMAHDGEAEKYAVRTKQIYKLMKSGHPIATGREDTVFAALMAFSDRSDEALVAEDEAMLDIIKKRFGGTDASQSAAHVLVFAEGTPEEKTERLFALYDALAEIGVKYGKHEELATLAALSVIAGDIREAAENVKQISEYLDGQKGYGGLSVSKKTRHMQAAMIAADLYCGEGVSQLAANVSTLVMVAAQQAAVAAAVVAATAASTNASN